MKTSVIGFPRVGELRELKFASEKYFRNEINVEELQSIAKSLRKKHWLLQAQQEIDFIPSNDFSFYDNMLDTAVLLNVIPKRYQELKLSSLDTYFAMARGYQGKKGDVKALAMKKWFNTNYHYMVAELDDTTNITLQGTKPFDEYDEAKQLNIITKPVFIGPFTFLKLARYTGEKKAIDFIDDITNAYIQILRQFQNYDTQWIQFDEPYLVHDLTQADIQLFNDIYTRLLSQKSTTNILLQTYFGDIRDCYKDIIALNFDGIGLDFVEGKKTFDLVKEYSFPQDKVLFAGIENGKNIWRNSYARVISIVQTLQECNIHVVIGTSCSLLHVPFTIKNESKLSPQHKKHFAFAIEKLQELNELKDIIKKNDISCCEYINNVRLFQEDRNCTNHDVKKRVDNISQADLIRFPSFEEREKIQKDIYQLPLFPTTTIGSFPQTKDVKANRTAFKKGRISEDEYISFNKQMIKECVALQEELDIDVLVHGEFERNDMVEYFGECLHGYIFTEKAWVQSYGTRCVKPPIIWGDISREKAMSVDWSVYAQSLTNKPMKGMLTGPVTILNWSFPREDISLKESAYQIALAIRDEVLDLESHGISIIQVDEAALREKLPLRKSDWYGDYLDWAIPSFCLVHSGVQAQTQIHTHMCYSEFTDIIDAIDDMDADVITFEASRSDLLILDALKQHNFRTQVGPGVYDIHSPRIPSVAELYSVLEKMTKKIPIEKLWVNPDCGLKTRGNVETIASLRNMMEACRKLRENHTV